MGLVDLLLFVAFWSAVAIYLVRRWQIDSDRKRSRQQAPIIGHRPCRKCQGSGWEPVRGRR